MEEKLRSYYKEVSLEELEKAFKERLRKVGPTMEHLRETILKLKIFLLILKEGEAPEEVKRDLTSAILYFCREGRRWPLIGYCSDYKLVNYVYKKHEKFIKDFQNKNKFTVNYL